MPWEAGTVEDSRARFVLEAEESFFSFSELCRRHGITRKTGYKWVERYRTHGLDGLSDRSHRPALGAVGLVGEAGHRSGDDRAGKASTERPARADASDIERSYGPAPEREPTGPAGPVRSFPTDLQRGAAARRDRTRDARQSIHAVVTPHPPDSQARVPWSLRAAKDRRGRDDPLARHEGFRERDDPVRLCRARGDFRKSLGRLLRTGLPRLARRGRLPHHGCQSAPTAVLRSQNCTPSPRDVLLPITPSVHS